MGIETIHAPSAPRPAPAPGGTPPALPPRDSGHAEPAYKSGSPKPPTSKRGGLAIWAAIVLLIAAIAAVVYWRTHSAATANAAAAARGAGGPIPVVVSTARIGDVPIYLPELGSVTPIATVTVRTQVNGQLDKVAFTEGQIVHQGDLLAEVDPRPFAAAVEQAQGNLQRDQALLDNAKLDLSRYTTAAPGTFTQQQIDTQKALVDQYAGTVQADQGILDNAKVQLNYCQIKAPVTGLIGLRLVDPGNIVSTSDTNGLAVISQLQPTTVVFTIADVDIPKVLDDSATVPSLEVDAYSSDMTRKLATGVLTAADSQIDPTTAKLKLRATFANKNFRLFPSQFVNVQLLVKTLHGAVIVPPGAVQRGPDNSTFVYVVKPDQTVAVRTVTLGPTQADLQAIQSGVSAGDVVVTDGVDKLQDGSKVSPHQAAATTQPSTDATGDAAPHHHHHNTDTQTGGATTRSDASKSGGTSGNDSE
jgi:membrane fusion protein, multidrug efflux system